MVVDPIELQMDRLTENNYEIVDGGAPDHVENMEPSTEWSEFRDNLAEMMWENRQRGWSNLVLVALPLLFFFIDNFACTHVMWQQFRLLML